MNSKTFAIITDVHSNLASLIKALNLIDQRSDVNQVICLGDCFALGPEPEATLVELKRVNNCIFIRGNHDRYLIEKLWESDSPSLEGMDPNDPICKAIVGNEKWTAELLGKEGHDFCSEMRISHSEIVHNTYIDFTHAYFERDEKPPSIEEALIWRDGIAKQNPKIEQFVFVHGHVHVPRHQVVENLTILCQGATGLPFDRDQRGAVAFLKIENNKIDWDVVRYDYDHNETSAQLEKRKPPFYINLKNTIKFASIRNDL